MTRSNLGLATVMVFVTGGWLAGCGDSGLAPVCVAGSTVSCVCTAGGAMGTQTCASDGTGFGLCTGCPDGPDMAMPIVSGSNTAKFVASSMTLPKNSMTSAYDLDGDGTPDNRLGSIIQAISAIGLDPQSSTTASVDSGQLVLLFEETSTDTTQQSALNAGVKQMIGTATVTPPLFDGTDKFTVATSSMPAQFVGNITAGTFTSADPATATVPVAVTLLLPLVAGQPPLALPITAAHLTFTRSTSGTVTGGQINGGIKKTDVDSVIVPAVAALITAQLQMPNPSATLKSFDTNMDGTVTAAEIMSNALISNILAPDVQLFQAGVYKPNPAKTTKDSLSLGVSFTAVTAKF